MFTEGQKLFLAENSEIPIFTITSKLEGKKNLRKKGMHWLGQGTQIGINEN